MFGGLKKIAKKALPVKRAAKFVATGGLSEAKNIIKSAPRVTAGVMTGGVSELVAAKQRANKSKSEDGLSGLKSGLSTYEGMLGNLGTQVGPSNQANLLMGQAGLQAQSQAANQARQLAGETASAYGNLGLGAGGARENIGMKNIGATTQGLGGIYSGLMGNQMNIMNEDVARKQAMLKNVMASKASTSLGNAQAKAANKSGGLFGSGGFMGLGF